MRTIVFVVLLLTASVVFGQDNAIPELTGRVVDLADILLPETERMLDSRLRAHEDTTSDQIAVLTIPSLEGESIESFSLRVANGWGLGQSGSDNGVLVTVAVEDRRMRIEVGYGLEEQLPDALAGQIIRNEMRPPFRNGDFDGGVISAVESILGALDGSYILSEESDGEKPGGLLLFLVFGIWTLIPLFALPTLLVESSPVRWFALPFLVLFPAIGGSIVTGRFLAGLIIAIVIIVGVILLGVYMSHSPKWIDVRKQVAANKRSGKATKVRMLGMSFSVGGPSSSGGSSSSGFSGGGGSFGGGGSSGSW